MVVNFMRIAIIAGQGNVSVLSNGLRCLIKMFDCNLMTIEKLKEARITGYLYDIQNSVNLEKGAFSEDKEELRILAEYLIVKYLQYDEQSTTLNTSFFA